MYIFVTFRKCILIDILKCTSYLSSAILLIKDIVADIQIIYLKLCVYMLHAEIDKYM